MTTKTEIAEPDLRRLLCKNNRQAIVYSYDKYAAALFGIVTKLIKDEMLAQIVLQKSFVKMWQQTNTLGNYDGTLFIWMHNITRNVAIEELNKAIRHQSKLQRINNLSGNLA